MTTLLGLVAVVLLIVLVSAAVVSVRRRSRPRRIRSRTSGPSVATHYPMDDPHWREYSKRLPKHTGRSQVRQRGTARYLATNLTIDGTPIDVGDGGGGGCGGGGCGGGD